MKKTIAFILIFSVAALPVTAQELPDLQVRDLIYAEQTDRLVATIYNQAQFPAEGPVIIHFYDNDEKIGEIVYDEIIPRYSIVSVYINYKLAEGEHNFRAVVDPFNRIAETRESNNERSYSVRYETNKTAIVIQPSQPEEKQQIPEGNNMRLYISLFIVTIIGAYLFFKIPYKKSGAVKKKKHEIERKEGKETLRIREIDSLPEGRKVRFHAEIRFHDKIGDDYTYFLKDASGEIVGFSKKEIKKKSGHIYGVTQHFLGKNIAVRIQDVD